MSGLTRGPLLRLLVPFVVLALILIAIVVGMMRSALARLEEQRELRHRMVAERVFDELEREIGSVLQHEAERPSQAYDADQTDPARWSRFVLGYYRRDPELTLLAEARLGAVRAAQLREILERSRSTLELRSAQDGAAKHNTQKRVQPTAASKASLDGVSAAPSSPDLVGLLNRSGKLREYRMHEFSHSFAVVTVGQLVVAERQAHDADRAEGLVIDVALLLDTIQGWLFGSPNLRDLAVLRLGPQTPGAAHRAAYHYQHRLAAPFDAYQVWLDLARLDDADAGSALYRFAALFALAAVLGLLAICRMMIVQVAFAERRNNFVSAVTHELRTPLTSIRMYAEMLRDGMVRDDTTKQEYYTTITAEGERLTRLINNVMEHGRLRRGQRHAQLQRGNPAIVVREVVEMMRPHIEREGFALELQLEPQLREVELDADALKQILFNVLDNALKYGCAEPHAKIDVACQASESGAVVICVRDYGPGVPDKQLASLFEPFYRGENELTRTHQGTGLGLALVRDLAALMKGRVQAHNRAPGFELQILLRQAW